MSQEPNFKRWYDHDPLLLKVINLLKDYQDDLREQAEIFLQNVEEKVSKEAIDKFYNLVKPLDGGARWYDNDPVMIKAVEMLRQADPKTQRVAALKLLLALEKNNFSEED